jgi:hypothetical protein
MHLRLRLQLRFAFAVEDAGGRVVSKAYKSVYQRKCFMKTHYYAGVLTFCVAIHHNRSIVRASTSPRPLVYISTPSNRPPWTKPAAAAGAERACRCGASRSCRATWPAGTSPSRRCGPGSAGSGPSASLPPTDASPPSCFGGAPPGSRRPAPSGLAESRVRVERRRGGGRFGG